MPPFISIEGVVTSIEPFMTSTYDQSCCTLLIGIRSPRQGYVYFIVDLNTYFVCHVTIQKGDHIIAFYDPLVPVPLIYPPRYRAVVIAKYSREYFVTVDYFDEMLISSNHQLKLMPSPVTKLLLPNSQAFLGCIKNRNLVVLYFATTKSIPAITTPMEVIVLCEKR
jgi:hypothetical protein